MATQVLGGRDRVSLAIAQVSPVYLNKAASLDRAETIIAEAAEGGADLIAFPEAWLAGYPYWTEGWDSEIGPWVVSRSRWYDNAVRVGSDDTQRLAQAARRHGIIVVMGCNEIDNRESSHTIYNTQLFFDRDGKLLGRHRKLMPTHGERQFWGRGSLADLQVFQTDIGRVGGLICGEHLLPLERAAMIELGEDIHIASFPGSFALHTGPKLVELDTAGDFWGVSSTRNHAFEAGAFVLRACAYVDPADIDPDFPHAETMNISYARGGSSIIGPLGVPLADSSFEPGIIYAQAEGWMIKAVKAIVDTAGHYNRPDVLGLAVMTPDGWQLVTNRERIPVGFGNRLNRAMDEHGVELPPDLGAGEHGPTTPAVDTSRAAMAIQAP